MTKELSHYLEDVLSTGDLQSITPIEKAIHGPSWSKSEQGKALIQHLSSTDAYSEFNGHLQMLGVGSIIVSLENLGDWLVERASSDGVAQAEKDLSEYNNSDAFKAYAIMLLANTHIDNEYEFESGVKLIHASSLQNDLLNKSIQINSHEHSLPLPRTECILAIPFEHKRFHWSSTGQDTEKPDIEIPYSLLEETKLCLVMARPTRCGIQSIATSVVVEGNIPIIHSISGWSLHSFKRPPLGPSILNIEMNNANELIKKLKKLEPDLKQKILSIIERLNGYSSGASMVEKSVDLRICLESIFLDDGNKEQLRYTLSLRAALFLGENLEERKDIMSKMKKAYDVTSTAVHTGKMPSRNVELLPEIAGLARKSILKLIEAGGINWQELELQV